MLFANQNDIIRCTELVRKEFNKRDLFVDDVILNKTAVDIMNISYAKGGGYSNSEIKSYAEVYIESEFYKKFIGNS